MRTQRSQAVHAFVSERTWAVSGPGLANIGSGRTQVEVSQLINLLGVSCRRGGWRGRTNAAVSAAKLVREVRGDLTTLLARGCEAVGETETEEDDEPLDGDSLLRREEVEDDDEDLFTGSESGWDLD